MRIPNQSIRKEIRLEGLALKYGSPLGVEKVQRIASPLGTVVLGMLPMKSLNGSYRTISRKNGSKMKLLILDGRKNDGSKTVGILWCHGGGYALGAPEMAIMAFPKHLLKQYNCVIVLPDYTLSAKAPYPAALEDCYTALKWMESHKEQLGIQSEKLVVGGESAGGGLTAALTLYCRDKGEDPFAFQIPLYPMLDDRLTSSSRKNNAPVWNETANRSAWHIYLDEQFIQDRVPYYAAPARAADLSNLPPAFSFYGSIEPFHDEDETYFTRLAETGTETVTKEYSGCYHAFDMMAPYAKVAKEATAWGLEQYADFVEKYV